MMSGEDIRKPIKHLSWRSVSNKKGGCRHGMGIELELVVDSCKMVNTIADLASLT